MNLGSHRGTILFDTIEPSSTIVFEITPSFLFTINSSHITCNGRLHCHLCFFRLARDVGPSWLRGPSRSRQRLLCYRLVRYKHPKNWRLTPSFESLYPTSSIHRRTCTIPHDSHSTASYSHHRFNSYTSELSLWLGFEVSYHLASLWMENGWDWKNRWTWFFCGLPVTNSIVLIGLRWPWNWISSLEEYFCISLAVECHCWLALKLVARYEKTAVDIVSAVCEVMRYKWWSVSGSKFRDQVAHHGQIPGYPEWPGRGQFFTHPR